MNTLPEHDRHLQQVEQHIETQQIDPRQTTVTVIGLGYVGLPLAVGFDRAGFDVIGYDISEKTVAELEAGIDTTDELGDDTVEQSDVTFTTDSTEIARSEYVLITVPTPVDEDNTPSMEIVRSAGEAVGEHLAPGTTVVLESTVYPGATREVLVPALEKGSGLTCGNGFNVGYSPERATPGDEEHGLEDVVKVVSGQTPEVCESVAALYEQVLDVDVYRAPSLEVAEASKVVENVQRDVNIALVNELAMTFEQMGIDTQAVLDAAATKWNFHEYEPGLVSGHCIPVDPYFLIHRARREGHTPELIRKSREVNESMPEHVADLVVKGLTEAGNPLSESRVLVLGLTYKADVADVRSSKVEDVLGHLREHGVEFAGYDPYVSESILRDRFEVDAQETLDFEGFDCVLFATPHDEFSDIDPATVANQLSNPPTIVDVYGLFDPAELPERMIYRRV
mgnify:CR=1 FL=1